MDNMVIHRNNSKSNDMIKNYYLLSENSIDEAFKIICKKGHTDIVKLIIFTRRDINIKSIERGWFYACIHGHLDIAMFIYDFDFKINYNCAFDRVCIAGHLIVAIWLYDNHLYYKNKHIMHDFANIFMNACINGKFEIAKWIINAEPEILNIICDHNDNINNKHSSEEYGKIRYIFNKTRKNGHYEINKWLANIINLKKFFLLI
jgi:hypothetical protein